MSSATQASVHILVASGAVPQSQQPPERAPQNNGQEQRTSINSQNTSTTRRVESPREELVVASETDTTSSSTIRLRERGSLLMCVNCGKFMTELSHIETTYLGNDHLLFLNVRASYEKLRGSALKRWSLYHPTSARLVRVGRSIHMFAD